MFDWSSIELLAVSRFYIFVSILCSAGHFSPPIFDNNFKSILIFLNCNSCYPLRVPPPPLPSATLTTNLSISLTFKIISWVVLQEVYSSCHYPVYQSSCLATSLLGQRKGFDPMKKGFDPLKKGFNPLRKGYDPLREGFEHIRKNRSFKKRLRSIKKRSRSLAKTRYLTRLVSRFSPNHKKLVSCHFFALSAISSSGRSTIPPHPQTPSLSSVHLLPEILIFPPFSPLNHNPTSARPVWPQ